MNAGVHVCAPKQLRGDLMADGGGEIHWRETYFILFSEGNRPKLADAESAIREISDRFEISHRSADENELLESIAVQAPEDNAAIEVTFESGEAVTEQASELAKQLREEADGDQLQLLLKANARLDVMHFEMTADDDDFDEDTMDEMFDPGSLLMVVDTLVTMTGGIAIDPATGGILPGLGD